MTRLLGLAVILTATLSWSFIHLRIARRLPRLTDPTLRGLNILLAIPGLVMIAVLNPIAMELLGRPEGLWAIAAPLAIVVLLIGLPRSNSQRWPCSFSALVCFYGMVALDVAILDLPLLTSGMLIYQLFMSRRNHAALLWPSRLPDVRRRSGVTLIELLIVLAMMSVFTVGVAHLVEVSHLTVRRQEDWRDAIELAEDQIALLRAAERLPAIGVHPSDEMIAQVHPLADRAEFEIRPGPTEQLREVWVRVRLQNFAQDRVVEMAVILPAERKGES
jgi:prepilin-type N-terminal cleavage/methylation domain-containing protein